MIKAILLLLLLLHLIITVIIIIIIPKAKREGKCTDQTAGTPEGDLDGRRGPARDQHGLVPHHVVVGIRLLAPLGQALVQWVAAAERKVACNRQ